MAGLKTALMMAFILALSYQHIAALCPSCPKECCFEYRTGRPLRATNIASFFRTDQECSLDAIVLVMKTGKMICVNPAERWVQRVIPKLENKK